MKLDNTTDFVNQVKTTLEPFEQSEKELNEQLNQVKSLEVVPADDETEYSVTFLKRKREAEKEQDLSIADVSQALTTMKAARKEALSSLDINKNYKELLQKDLKETDMTKTEKALSDEVTAFIAKAKPLIEDLQTEHIEVRKKAAENHQYLSKVVKRDDVDRTYGNDYSGGAYVPHFSTLKDCQEIADEILAELKSAVKMIDTGYGIVEAR